jgi:hypothetical protein
MEYYESEERSTPDSCSTSDISSQNEYSGNFSKGSSKNLKQTKLKHFTKSIFSLIISQETSLASDSLELKSWINDQILNECPDFLNEKFQYRCCENEKHSAYCFKKWEKIRESLIMMVDESLQESKPIFSIRKRPARDSKILLSSSQPSWIHRLVVQGLMLTSNN